MWKRLSGRLSPSTAISLVALFVSLGGAGYAATGDTFILGNPNTATSDTRLTASGATANALRVSNSNTAVGATALRLESAANRAPLVVNRSVKVSLLNVDLLDGIDSTGFIRRGFAQTAAVNAAGGVVDVTNTASTNGVQGRTVSGTASGVYGENTGTGGFGVAGRAGSAGNAIYGDNRGTGFAGYFEDKVHVGGQLELHNPAGPPMSVDSTARVDNLNADKVDGTSFVSNRIISQTQFDHILDVPGFGAFYVDGCDHTNVRFGWNSGGPNAYVTQGDIMNPGDAASLFQGVANVFTSTTRPRLFRVIQLARDTGAGTSMATVTLSAHATDCAFAAQATVSPG
jgi:hypothetical protein